MYLSKEAILQSIKNSAQNKNAPVSFMDILSLMEEGSYLFYEFEDKEITYKFDSDHPDMGTYTKYISPLFSSSVINDNSNATLLSLITEETPFYHLEPTRVESINSPRISYTRDPGINDVPAALQESGFYKTWFQDSQGYIQNYILLDVYNKLRWPFINENQYLNAALFPSLAKAAFNDSQEYDSLIEFRNSAEENAEDNKFYEGMNDTESSVEEESRVYSKVGCIDYLNNITNQKLQSTYSLIDYDPEQFSFLSNWTDSLYESGIISYDDIETQVTIYKLQDLKYELLRRKFAGSSTLYSLVLSSIDRQGSFLTTCDIGALSSSSSSFLNKRIVRLINIPGIISQYNDAIDIDPINTYYSLPLKNEKSPIYLSTLVPLYYSSTTLEKSYNAETFYLSTSDGSYRSLFLRNNNNIIEWSAPTSSLFSNSTNFTYSSLDETISSVLSASGTRYRTLDDTVAQTGTSTSTSADSTPFYLDRKKYIYKNYVSNSSLLDISANKLLFNNNTLQASARDDYPYLTYSIASNNSVSLMDLPWLEYLKNSAEKKSRVQDEISFGTQLSTYRKLDSTQTGRYTFFGLSYGIDQEDDQIDIYSLPKLGYNDSLRIKAFISTLLNRKCAEDETATGDVVYYERRSNTFIKLDPQPLEGASVKNYYTLPDFYKKSNNVEEKVSIHEQDNIYSLYIKENDALKACKDILAAYIERPKFAYLWYCVLKYSAEDFKPVDISYKLISKITLRVTSNSNFSVLDEYQELTQYNEGILPFTYPEAVNDKILGLKLGVYSSTIVEKDNSKKIKEEFYDDLSLCNYTKAKYIFSDSDNLKDSDVLNQNPANINSDYFSLDPSESTKSLYYAIRKGSVSEGYTYAWSDPIKVIPFTEDLLNNIEEGIEDTSPYNVVKPDWYGLGYFLNPYLNFTTNSASPLRYKKVEPSKNIAELELSEEREKEILTGPSKNAALSNLTRLRGYECTCNDDGDITLPSEWVSSTFASPATEIYGFYLNRYHPSQEKISDSTEEIQYQEYLKIYGDNRETDIFDEDAGDSVSDSTTATGDSRSDIYYDKVTKTPCLRFDLGEATESSSHAAENYLKLLPVKASYLSSYVEKKTEELDSEINSLILKINNYIDSHRGDIPSPESTLQDIEKMQYQIDWILENTVIDSQEITSSKSQRTSFEQKAIRMYEKYLSLKEELIEVESESNEEREKKVWTNWWWNKPSNGITVCADIKPQRKSDTSKGLLELLENEKSACIVSRIHSTPLYGDRNILPLASTSGDYYKVLHSHGQNNSGYYQYNEDNTWVFSETSPITGTYQGSTDFYDSADEQSFRNSAIDSEFSLDLVRKTSESIKEQLEEEKANYNKVKKEYDESVKDNSTVIEALKSDIYSNKITISNLESDITDLSNSISTAQAAIENNQEELKTLKFNLEGANSTPELQEDWKKEKEKLEAEISDLEKQRTETENNILNFEKELENSSDSNEKELLTKKIAEGREKLNSITTSLSTKETSLSDYTKRLEGVNRDVSTLTESIEKLTEKIDSDEKSLESLIEELSAKKTSLNEEKESLEKNDLQLKTLNEQLASLLNSVQSSLNKVAKLEEEIEYSEDHAIVVIKFSLYPQGNDKEIWSIESDNLLSDETTDFPYYNLRIAASSLTSQAMSGAFNTTLSLIVNSNIINSATFVSSSSGKPIKYVEGNSLGGIDIACHAYKNSSTAGFVQKNRFLGNIYDLRLYNEGYTGLGLLMLSLGSTRELFSYSPSIYKLGYSLYEDMSAFKEVARRTEKDSEIGSIRLFNRSIWDSILVDMYPISAEEMDSDAYQIRADYSDPQDDTNIYGIVNGEQTLSDCIEQTLEDYIEVYNNVSPISDFKGTCKVSYNSDTIDISNTDTVSIVNTTLYPVLYNKTSFTSSDVDFNFLDSEHSIITTIDDHEISLPSSVFANNSGEMEYDADVSLNWTIPTQSDFSVWYSHGSHISLNYNSLLNATTAIHSLTMGDTSVDKADNSQTNHILIPLTVPRQIDITDIETAGYFDRLNLEGVQLNEGISTLLKATSYYNELRVPYIVSYVDEDRNISYQYASKWDAIRTLKEGTYYITCKYPFQILPFTDYRFNINANAQYASLYATARFKIEVYGEPVVYQIDKNNAGDIRNSFKSEYFASNITNYLKSPAALINPVDNRTFPHRAINIDLYVQEVEGIAGLMKNNNSSGTSGSAEESYAFSWKLLGTNHPDDFNNSDSLIYLTEDALKDGLVLGQKIPVFFSKNYTASFFIAKTEKTSSGSSIVNSSSADDDLIDPIRINLHQNSTKIVSYVPATGVARNGIIYYSDNKGTIADPQPDYRSSASVEGYYTRTEDSDNLRANSEVELDNLVIAAGRSYKLLWDYTGNTCEFSFTDNLYSLESDAQKELVSSSGLPSYSMTSSEKTNFSRLSNVKDLSNSTEFLYTSDGLNYISNDLNIKGRLNGYYVTSSKYEETTVSKVTSLPTSQELINDYDASTGYRSCTILDYSESSVGEEDVVYLTNIGDSYQYYVWNTSTLEYDQIVPGTLKIDTVGILGNYYVDPSDPEKVYIAVILLDNDAFLVDNDYYTWNETEYKKAEINKVDEYGHFPYPGIIDELYEDESTGSIYKCVQDNDHFTDTSGSGASPFYFGNPYSRSSEHNYLLKIRKTSDSSSRFNICNSYYFPYVPTEVPSNDTTVNGQIVTDNLPVIKSSSLDATSIEFKESSVIKAQYSYMYGLVNNAISQISNNVSGVFAALSKVTPNYNYPVGSSVVVAENSYVRSVTDTLHAYYASDRIVPSKNTNVLITRRGLYSNNLLTNQEFDNNSAWDWKDFAGSSYKTNTFNIDYVSDEDWDEGLGKDVCELSYEGFLNGGESLKDNSENPLVMEYSTGSALVSAAYEAALSVKVISDSNFEEKYYRWNSETSSYDLIDSSDVIYIDSTIPSQGQENKLYVRRETSSSYIWKEAEGSVLAGFYLIGLEPYDPTVDGDESKVYVYNETSLVDVYICYMDNNAVVGSPYKMSISAIAQSNDGDLYSHAAFPDKWYVVSKELDFPVKANHVSFMFVCRDKVTLRLTKAVIRKSESTSHVLGLSDGLYTKSSTGSSSSITLTNHRVVVFKNIETEELLPIQFNNIIHNRPGTSSYDGAEVTYADTGLSSLGDFITRYSLGFPSSSSKLETLFSPWTRRLHFERVLSTDYISGYLYKGSFWEDSEYTQYIEKDSTALYLDKTTEYYYSYNDITETYEKTTPFVEVSYFTSYEKRTDHFGVSSRAENKTKNTNMYSSINMSYNKDIENNKKLAVNSLVLNTDSTSFLNSYSTNMSITSEYLANYNNMIIANGPITLEDETLSTRINCFDVNKCKKGDSSVVAVTNIQLLAPTDSESEYKTILYEFEFLPIIYDELKNHFSANIFLHKEKSA